MQTIYAGTGAHTIRQLTDVSNTTPQRG